MKYLLLLAMLTTAQADILKDIILTPLSWTDNEVKNYLSKQNGKNINIGGVNFDSFTDKTGKTIISQEALNKIKSKWKGSDNEDAIKAYFNLTTVNSVGKI